MLSAHKGSCSVRHRGPDHPWPEAEPFGHAHGRVETAQRTGRPKRRAASRPSIIETSDREDAREPSEADEEGASGAESEEDRTPVAGKRPAATAPQAAG